MSNKISVKPCNECGYYEDIIAFHYEECSKLEKILKDKKRSTENE